MAITVKHSKVSTVPDGDDSSLVKPSDWNADHQLVGTVPVENGGTGASTLTGYVKGNGTSTMTASATIPNTDVTGLGTMSTQNANNVAITGGTMSGVAITGYIPTTEKAQPLGVATLDAGGKVPQSQIPLMGDLNYQGTWNASTNTPTLVSSVGTKGYYYVVDVSGSTNLNGITDWVIGDWAIFNGSIWQKVDNTDAVTSVNGQVGTVVLTTTNIAEGTNLYYTDARARASNSAGTGISYDNATGVITNSAPDQTVSLTGGTGISTSGTYPNFTITNTSPSLGGDVVGPASATDNAIARYDTTTGKLLQNSLVIIDDTGSVTGVNALTAQSLTVNNNATLGSSNTDTLDVRARISSDLDPETNNAKDIGTNGRNWRDAFFGRTVHTVNLELTGTTSFDGSQGTSGQVLTSAGTGNTPTWTTPTTGTVTSVAATAGTGISITGSPITTSGTLNITNTAPDQVVSLTGAGTTSISGTYPNFTVTSNDQFTGTVTSVSGTAPIISSGGNTPAISISQATTSTNGYLSSTDWNTFNGKAPAFTYTTGYIPFGQGTTTPNQDANLFWDNSAKNLGVGTASPARSIDVTKSTNSGNSFAFPSIKITNTLATQGNASTTWNFARLDIQSANGLVFGDVGTRYDTDYSGMYVGTETSHPLTLQTGGTERLRVDTSGRIGIGTSTIDSFAKLKIEGTAGNQSGASQQVIISAPTTTVAEGAGIRFNAASGAKESVGIIGVVNEASGNLGAMTFHTYNGGGNIPEWMRISSVGGLSLGTTTNPGAGNLLITGSITASQTAGIIGTTTNNNANAGSVGQYVESWSGYFTNTTTAVNATSISLTAGDWDVYAATSSGGASATCTASNLGINTTSATFGTQTIDYITFAADPVQGAVGNTFFKRISLASTTTVYGITATTAGTATFTSVRLSARRMR